MDLSLVIPLYNESESISELNKKIESILSTSKGVLSDNEARSENVGGEILCKVF